MSTRLKALLILFVILIAWPVSGNYEIHRDKGLLLYNTAEVPELRIKLEDNSTLIVFLSPNFILQEFHELGKKYDRTTRVANNKAEISGVGNIYTYELKKKQIKFLEMR